MENVGSVYSKCGEIAIISREKSTKGGKCFCEKYPEEVKENL